MIEINHTFIYQGRQINELWAFSALCPQHHRIGNDSFHKNRSTKDYIQWLCLIRAKPSELAKYPKFDWAQLKRYLDKLFLK